MKRERLIQIVCLLMLMVSFAEIRGQETWFSLNVDSLAKEIPQLSSDVDISVSNVSMQEFLRAIANSSGLNLNVDPLISENVVNNFNDVEVKDMLIFLELNYPIDIEVIGNIVNIRAREVSETIETDFKGVKYDSVSQMITLDYYQADLNQVAREITKITEYNLILSPAIATKQVTAYVEEMPFRGAMEQFAFSNDLSVRVTESGYYILEAAPVKETAVQAGNSRQNSRNRSNNAQEEYVLELKKTPNNTLSVYCSEAPLDKVISAVGDELNASYFISSALEGKVSLKFEGVDFSAFLLDALNGSPYIYHQKEDIFIIGKNDTPTLKHCEIFQFQNRTIDKVVELLPEDSKQDLMITEFPDLNSLLISGEASRIQSLNALLTSIDKTVPVILIEVIIVNVSSNYSVSTGIEAGIGEAPVQTQGKVFPGVDIQIGADDINRVIDGFSGFGVLNLGQVNANFYLTLKALEEQGILEVSSTPKLSTLNGHEAMMNIGNLEYYLEETSNYIGTQNPSLSTAKIYKSVIAELAVTIRPVVSGDDQITLDILVEQSDFTERISKDAPPGSVNRKFESLIRVKNQEMIILGGLEEKRHQDSSSGVPLISRIPILKWFFSSRTRTDSKSKLNIFIKPTIIG